MTDEISCPEWLKSMPKTDLHCHLGGSIRLDTVLELADNYGIQLPSADKDKLRSEIVYKDRQDKSLASYIKGIKLCESVLIRPEAFQRAAYEICEDAHAENVKVLELRFAPTNYVHDSLRLHDVVESTLDGLRSGANHFNMLTGLIICGIKSDMKSVREAAEVAVNYQDYGVVGFDLAGKEKGYPPKAYREVIMPVLHNFLPVTIHAGEEDTVGSIAEAIIHLNARRIGHAVTLRESTKLVEYANKTRLGLEVCLTSNVDTGSVASYSTHPVRAYFLADLRTSINTDNRTISDTTVTQECMKLMQHLGFSQKDIYAAAKHGIKSAFIENHEAKRLLDELDGYFMKK